MAVAKDRVRVFFSEDSEVCKGVQVQVLVILLFYACCAPTW